MARQTYRTDPCNKEILDCYDSGVASNCKVPEENLVTNQLDVHDLSSLPIRMQITLFCDVTSCSLVAVIHCLQLQDRVPVITFQKTDLVRRCLRCTTVPLPRLCPVQTYSYFPFAFHVGPYKAMSIPWHVGRARRKLDDVLLLTSPAVYEWITHTAHTVQTRNRCPMSTAMPHWSGTTIPLVMVMKYSPYAME